MIKLKDLNFPILIGGVLGIAALIGLNIIVLNAEFLVAVCFVLLYTYTYIIKKLKIIYWVRNQSFYSPQLVPSIMSPSQLVLSMINLRTESSTLSL